MAKAMHLIKAYMSEQIPANGGFIISSFFDPDSAYAIYELTAYKNVKDIYQTPEGLTFKTDGNRTHMLVEPATYAMRFTEPVHREKGKSIPYRFDDMTLLTGKRQEKIMVPKAPVFLYSSFTILNDQQENFSFLFFPTEDVYLAIKKFLADSLYNDCGLSKNDAKNASELFLETVKKFTVWS
ncbi:MAG TPA: hypothetical protein VF857_03025 [Spirochaetota bacterium]